MPGGARADGASDRLQCQDRDAQPDIRIGACSRLIQSGLYKGTDLGVIFNKRGIAFYKKRQYDYAIEDYSQAIGINPDDAMVFNNRGLAYRLTGRFERVIADHGEAIRLNPRDAGSYNNRGLIYEKQRRYGRAIEDYSRAIGIDPDLGQAVNNLAWILATAKPGKFRDGLTGVEMAKRAFFLSQDGPHLDTLAAAFAEADEFAAAVRAQQRAMDLLRQSSNDHDKVIADFQSRLDLYRQGKPYRE